MYFQLERSIISKIKILCQNLARWDAHFHYLQCHKSRILDFLKVILELFWSYLGIIFGLKKRILYVVKLSKFKPLFALWKGHFDHFQCQKTRFLGFLKVVLEMFRSCLGIIFRLKRLTFGCIFSSKCRYMTSKIKIFGQNLALWEGHFDHFQGQKSRFLGFLKVVLEMFRSCLGIIFGLKMPTFSYIFSSKGRYIISKIKILCQNLALWEGHLDHFLGQKTGFLEFFKVGLESSEAVWALFSAFRGVLWVYF